MTRSEQAKAKDASRRTDDGLPADIVITTALIPGRKAPVLVTEEMVMAMKPGSVIVDLAVEQGGNCPLSQPGATVVKHGVYIVGAENLAAKVGADASALYARNLLDFLKLIVFYMDKTMMVFGDAKKAMRKRLSRIWGRR